MKAIRISMGECHLATVGWDQIPVLLWCDVSVLKNTQRWCGRGFERVFPHTAFPFRIARKIEPENQDFLLHLAAHVGDAFKAKVEWIEV